MQVIYKTVLYENQLRARDGEYDRGHVYTHVKTFKNVTIWHDSFKI